MNRRKCRSIVVLSSSSSSSDDAAEEVEDSLGDEDGKDDSSPSHGEDDDDLVDDEVSSYCPSGEDDSDLSEMDGGDDDDESDGDYQYSDEDQAEQEEEQMEKSSDDDACGGRGDDDDDSQYKLVTELLERGRGRDLRKLTLKALRVYLRRHGLRISGSKDVCLTRIQEHWRLKDGNGAVLYPRSSFSINCKGDVCKGDVVLFTQKVYKKFDRVKRCGEVLGSRTVAGRVVKESYGEAKQQHTFTVEVLWSKGTNKLPPLFPLLVKGRNLYRMKTYRQPWENEAERSKVLDEKHERGARARQKREVRLLSKDLLKKTCSSNNGHLNQNLSSLTRASQLKGSGKTGKGYRNRMGSTSKHKTGLPRPSGSSLKRLTMVKVMGARTTKPTSRNRKDAYFRDKYSTSEPFCDAFHQQFYGKQREYSHHRNALPFTPKEQLAIGPPAFTRLPATPKPYGFPHQAPCFNFYGSGYLKSAQPLQPFDYDGSNMCS